jgi:diguanylate cyclase (GGDEF)-like protein/putative nucleotidyltransferase with HDIG domain
MGLLPIGGGEERALGKALGTGAALAQASERPGHLNPTEAGPLARAMAALGIGAAVLGLLAVVLPHPSGMFVPGLLALQALTVAIAVPLVIYAERVPLALVRVMPAVGTLIGTLCIVFSGDATSAYAMFYLWVGFFAFHFLSRKDAILHIGFAGGCYAVAIALTASPEGAAGDSTYGNLIHHFVITVGTLLIAGALLLYLRGKVEELMGRLTDAARTDLLTGLRNRRGIHEVLDAEIERASLGVRSLSLLVADLDHFKDVNDRLGQRTGDRLLQRVGTILDEATRRLDTVGRTAGEEFAIVLPEADERVAYLLADQLLARVRRAFADEPVPLTTSFGVATYPSHARDVEELFSAADEALYAAKALGRDRAVLYSPEVSGILRGIEGRRPVDAQGHLATVLSLAEALDLRDGGTARHSQTVGRYAERMARELGLPDEKVERVRLAGILHDIGKVAISDSILQKPGPLDDHEWALMRQHTEIGARILSSPDLADIRGWVLASHERPDGKGYPRRLAGDEIPLEARILAVADAYEAMTADRVYRRAIGERAAREELDRCSGTQFDPDVVRAFVRALDREPSSVI